jgi:hypothetical protein
MQRQRNSTLCLQAGIYALLLNFLPNRALADWAVTTQARLSYDENVGDAQSSDDIVADSIVSATASVYQLLPLDDRYSLTILGNLDGELFHRLNGLSNASLGGGLLLRRRWGLGALAPWARLGLQAARTDYRDDYRNGWLYRGTLEAGRRVAERWNLRAQYAWERRTAQTQPQEVAGISGDAFSTSSNSLTAAIEFSLSESTYLDLGLAARHGDVVSTTLDHYNQLSASRAIAADPAFGGIAYAYKLTATTLGVNLGIKYAPIAHGLLGFEFRRSEARADGGNYYLKSLLALTWDYGF